LSGCSPCRRTLFVLLTGESLQLSTANASSGYNESSTLIEGSTSAVSFTMDRECPSSNVNMLTAGQPPVDSMSAESDLANHVGAVRDSVNVAMSVSSQLYDSASAHVPLLDTKQRETKTATTNCSSVSSCAHSASYSQSAVYGQPHSLSHSLWPNQTVPFKVVF